VFFLTGRPLTGHFADTSSPIAGMEVVAVPCGLPAEQTSLRVTRRWWTNSSSAGCSTRSEACSRAGSETARPFGGLVYRQALEHLHGVRDEGRPRAHRAGEPPVLATPVDLVPQRA